VRDSEIFDSLYDSRSVAFKKELTRIPGIEKVSYLSTLPGTPISSYANSVRRLTDDATKSNQYKFIWVDEHFVDVLGLNLMAGRIFNATDGSRTTLIINELAAKTLGYQKPEESIGDKIDFLDDTCTIVGVVNDFHYESPKNPILPIIYAFRPDGGLFYLVPIETNSSSATIEKVEALFTSIFPGHPFSYFFLDEKYNNQYQRDIQFEKAIALFAALLIFVTILGLFGLSAYTAMVRTKEIGIRKVLGATETSIVTLLCKEYLLLILVATLIAVPTTWYVMNAWLDSFAMKISLTPWMFIFPSLGIIVVTLLTISFQTIKAALTNPADTLRTE
jgi:putative ABC transport system permease protein